MTEGANLFKKDAIIINDHFHELNYFEDEYGLPQIAGNLMLQDEHGALIDAYSIKIVPSDLYPYRFPKVFEINGRIPINTDWHVFPDGHCCIKSIPEEIYICKKGINLFSFIREQVIPYFFNQKYREINGFYLHERAHGTIGNVEFFTEIFRTRDLRIVLQLLQILQGSKKFKSNKKCVCGSKSKFKKCHRRTLRNMSLFSRDEISFFIEMVKKIM